MASCSVQLGRKNNLLNRTTLSMKPPVEVIFEQQIPAVTMLFGVTLKSSQGKVSFWLFKTSDLEKAKASTDPQPRLTNNSRSFSSSSASCSLAPFRYLAWYSPLSSAFEYGHAVVQIGPLQLPASWKKKKSPPTDARSLQATSRGTYWQEEEA